MPSIEQFLNGLAPAFPALFKMFFAAFWLAGLIFIAWGINQLRQATDQHGRGNVSPVTASAISIILGSVLCYMPTMLESVAITIFGNQAAPVGLMDYQTPGDSTGNVFIHLRTFLQMVGIYYFGNGWIMLRHVGIHGETNGRSFSGGVVKIIAGICLVHIVDTLKLLASSFGIPVLNQLLTNIGG